MLHNNSAIGELHAPLFVIRLPDPASGGLTRKALTEIADLLEVADEAAEINAIVVLGGKSSFCIGLSLDEFLAPSGLDDLANVLRRCFHALARTKKPIVVVVEGPAIGLGVSLLCHADVVVADRNATFEAPFVSLGLLPEAGSTMMMTQRIGYLRAIRLLCLTEALGAQEALDLGLVSEVTETNPRSRGFELAGRLAKLPADAVRTTKKLMRGSLDELDRRIDLEVAASRQRLGDARVRRRVALFAGVAKSGQTAIRRQVGE